MTPSPADQIVVSGAREHNLKDVTVDAPSRRDRGHHGTVGFGQVVARLRHDLRRGSAPLRRVAERLRAAVPGPDGQARRRLDRGPVAGHLDRPEDDLAQPAVDRRHGHRDLRLPAPAVVARSARPTATSAARRSPASRPSRSSTRSWSCRRATRFMVEAPVVRGRKGEYGKDLLEELRGEGFTRAKIDGELRLLEEDIVLDKKYKHDISVVVDRLRMREDLRKRLADSIETAVALADGIVESSSSTAARSRTYSEKFACLHHGTSMPELEPRIFSFNSPHGACPRCTGLGSQMEIDPELIVPDPSLSIGEGAIVPWSTSASDYYEQITEAIAERYEIDLDAPWEDLPEDAARPLPLRDQRRPALGLLPQPLRAASAPTRPRFEGIVPNLERRYRETDSDYGARRSRSTCRCGRARRARARGCGPSRARCWSAGWPINEFTALSAHRALEWLAPGRAHRHRAAHRPADPARDRGAAALPGQRRHRLPVDGPRRGDAVGRRGAADPAGDPDRLVAGRGALHPRRAVDRPAPARQRAA